MSSKTFARTKTDSAGRYQLRDLPAGKMIIAPKAPAMVGANDDEEGTTKRRVETEVSLDESEALKDVNFSMTRGGVITGRITTEDGRPVIAQPVMLTAAPAETAEGAQPPAKAYPRGVANTDDRGVYRIYGIEPGRYLISCGRDNSGDTTSQTISFGESVSYYNRVYYPAAISASEAGVIEVSAGSEAANIDLRLGKLLHGFRASGRITNGTNGSPVKQAFLRASRVGAANPYEGSSFARTDENGEFTFSGVQNGSYKISSLSVSEITAGSEDLYVPETTFEVADADVTGIEIKAKRGLTISGNVVVENTSNDPLPFHINDLNIFATVADSTTTEGKFASLSIKTDGSFTGSGLQPGRVRFQVWSMTKGISLRSADRGGVPQPGAVQSDSGNGTSAGVSGGNTGERPGIPFDRDHPLNDVTLRVVYGNCRLRGVVLVENGVPATGPVSVELSRTDGSGGSMEQKADSRGRFLFEGLTPGQYEVRTTVDSTHSAIKLVTISNGADNNVTLNAAETGGTNQ
jgi:protocatechuate 3,4-dioxygenase beta subunit